MFGCWFGSGAWKVLSILLGKISNGDFSRRVDLVTMTCGMWNVGHMDLAST